MDVLAPLSVAAIAEDLLSNFTLRWWQTSASLPAFKSSYSALSQRLNEKELDQFSGRLLAEAKSPHQTPEMRQALQDRLGQQAAQFGKLALGLTDRHLEAIRSYGFWDSAADFARQARQFDPEISMDNITQAWRNVWSMNLMQLLFGLPVEVTPAVFAYSMLYPITDNYLDDPAVTLETKRAFNKRFRQRLEGNAIIPANLHEHKVCDLVEMIEARFERQRFPQVYESLLLIHAAQGRSVALQSGRAMPYEMDTLSICFDKGGASTLADAYLVAGDLTPAQAEFAYYYGCVTQLVDDLEDVDSDLRAGIMTIFSQSAAGHWMLDNLTNRSIQFSMEMAKAMQPFINPHLAPLQEMIELSLPLVFIDSVGLSLRNFTHSYSQTLEEHFPFRFASLNNQRKRLYQKRKSLNDLAGIMLVGI